MTKLSCVILSLAVAACSAFVQPSSSVVGSGRTSATAFVAADKQPAAFATFGSSSSSNTALSAEDTYWEGEYPPSKVLGPIMSKMPSALLGMLSIVFLTMCVYSCGQSFVLQQEPDALASGSWVKWYYVAGSFGGPLAWGTHVACWIQRKNGM